MNKNLVLQSKIAPPKTVGRTLERPRVMAALLEALEYRLTLVQAGAGYGKSTALARLAQKHKPVIWYQVGEEDGDPLVFLLHLCHAVAHALPGLPDIPISVLESWEGNRGPLPSLRVIDQLLNSFSQGLETETLLVIDDAHLVIDIPEIAHILDRLIALAPPLLHIILAGRPLMQLPNLHRWQVRGEVLNLDQAMFAFTEDEIRNLFNERYQYELSQEEAANLYRLTEGWAIALLLVWRSLRSGVTASIEDAFTRQTSSLDGLFQVLAHEVLDKQPPDVQGFLRTTAVLREMTPQVCDAVRQANDSASLMAYLRRQELFVVDLGDERMRYHHIFHQFLRRISTHEERVQWHKRAAAFYRQTGDNEAAIYHHLQSGDVSSAAELLVNFGNELLSKGRLETLANYLDTIPPDILHHHPELLFYHGDLARLHSRFQEALGWYQQAETLWRERGFMSGVARALRGQARVYLDTVNPARAEELLERSLRLSDGTEDREVRARLYELLAENKLNAGKLEEAEQLRQQAQALRQEGPADSQLLFRVLLRTGRIAQAREALEARVAVERKEPIPVPRAHRETLFLLSIIYAMLGEAESAYRTAVEGTQRGLELNSPYVTAVGHMRQGHAIMLLHGESGYAQAREQFEKAVEISRSLAIPRLRVEAYWGLCRAYGYQGHFEQAAKAAEDGIEIAEQAGDEWIASLIRTAMGGSLILAGRFDAAKPWLQRAMRGFHECSDTFGYTAARLWLALGLFRQGDEARLQQLLPGILQDSKTYDYAFLFTRPTLVGVPDERILVPLLIYARDHGLVPLYASELLHSLGLDGISIHPGYQLRVFTLGRFEVWRGTELISNQGWRREKTRKLFQLMLAYRHHPLDREQIFEHLWHETDPATAGRNFKVILNTLYNVLEPNRAPGADSAYILRQGSVYGLRPQADIFIDATEFEKFIEQGEAKIEADAMQAVSLLEQAIALYQGDFLPDCRYDAWAAGEREHLTVLFLRAADQLCSLYLEQAHVAEVIELSQRILAQDNCWERAYRYLMQAYAILGDHGQVARTFKRCEQTLREELDVPPSAETLSLYQKLTQQSA